MDFGVVLQTNPPASKVVELARLAELEGFDHVWTFDSHILWQEPYVIYSAILAATRRITVGPMVTNPATRDWTVTASVFATLNEMFGNRTICGIGRGDSAVRVTNGRPTTLATLRDCVHVVRELANGRGAEYNGSTLRFPWGTKSELEVWIAAYGPKALALAGEIGDGFILQLADPDITAWSIKAVRDAAEAAGRDPDTVTICVAAPAYVGDDIAHQRDQCRWFGGMVGNHVADIVGRYGAGGANIPTALTDYIKGREGYDYNEHGRAGNTHTQFVPDEIIDRFCVLGPPEAHVARLKELHELGVDQFAIYLQHDAKEHTLAAYGNHIIPELARTSQLGRSSVTHRAPSIETTRFRHGSRRVVMFVIALALAAMTWELYKAIGPENGGDLLGMRVLPKAENRAMPHVWEMISRFGRAENRGSTSTVFHAVAAGAWFSFRIALAGLAIGTVVGFGLAVLMARFRVVERGLLPWLIVSQTVPLIALAPLVVSWSGRINIAGLTWKPWMSTAVIAAFLAFFPMAVGALRGLSSPPPAAIELMDSYAAPWRATLFKLRIPAAIPFLVPAFRLSANAAVVGTIIAELSTGLRGGIGRLVLEYMREATGDPAKVYTGVIGASAVGLAMAALVAVLERVLARNRRPEALA